MPEPSIRIEVEGLDELRRDLRRAQDSGLDAAMKRANEKAAREIEKEAKRHAPVLTGALKDSIRSTGTPRNARVRIGSARVPYANPIHWGWPRRHISPQPFVQRAIEEKKDSVRQQYQQDIQHVLNQLGGR